MSSTGSASPLPPVIHTPGGGGSQSHSIPSSTVGGRFDFDDGGVYVGGWLDGKAHGHGVCTGPKSQGEYSGSWSYGFELSGIYKWPSGATYEGQWQNGKRHGLGVEYRGKWVYRGEWTQGYKGRYGVRASLLSAAKYEGTWANGLQDGYGSETYADGGTYQGQWLRGMRHGYGVRQSAPFGHCNITKTALQVKSSSTNVSLHSLEIDGEGTLVDTKRDATMRGGFVLVVRTSSGRSRRRASTSSKAAEGRSASAGRGGFFRRLKKQKSTGDLPSSPSSADQGRTSRSSQSVASSTESGISSGARGDNEQGDAISNASFLTADGDINDPSTTETYMGEWKNDKRCGFGICERSDGVRYEGEWYNNKKYGYGVTTARDGVREEGKYKNNILVTSLKKKHLFVIRSAKTRERIESAVQASHRAQQIALQKADIAISRTATARGTGEKADFGASTARSDNLVAFQVAKNFGLVQSPMMNNINADGQTLLVPDVPLRRRGSNISQIRRGTKESLAQPQPSSNFLTPPGGGPGGGGGQMMPQQQPVKSTQFLDPNVPFGGRRGSFRSDNVPSSQQTSQNQMNQQQRQTAFSPPNARVPNQSGPNLMMPNKGSSPQQQFLPIHQQQQQMNVPQMSFEPPTPQPSFNQPYGQQSGQQPSYPSSSSSSQNFPSSSERTMSIGSNQFMADPMMQRGLPGGPPNQPRSRLESFTRAQGSTAPSNFSVSFQQQQQQQQLMQQQHQERMYQQQQQQQSSYHQQPQSSAAESFSDHFDHYSYRNLVSRYGSIPRGQSAPTVPKSSLSSRSRTPVMSTPASSPSSPSNRLMQSPSDHHLHRQQQQHQPPAMIPVPNMSQTSSPRESLSAGGSPVTMRRSFPNTMTAPNLNIIQSSHTPSPSNLDSRQESILNFPSELQDSFNENSLNNKTSQSNLIQLQANQIGSSRLSHASLLSNSMFNSDSGSATPNRGAWRTSSLMKAPVSGGVIGGGGGHQLPPSILKRKPSVQHQIFQQTEPAIPREQASALSHQQREYLRSEAEMAEKLKSNPFLYLVNPRFKEWLSRQKLIILIIVINIALAYLFYQIMYPSNSDPINDHPHPS